MRANMTNAYSAAMFYVVTYVLTTLATFWCHAAAWHA
jgi:hypothetical protein